MTLYRTHDLAHALLRLPNAEFGETSFSSQTDTIAGWAGSQIREAQRFGSDPVVGVAVTELQRILGYYVLDSDTADRIVRMFEAGIPEISREALLPGPGGEGVRDTPDIELLLEEVASLAGNILAFTLIPEGLRTSLTSRVRELRTRECSRHTVVSLMEQLETYLRKIPVSASDVTEAPSDTQTPSQPPQNSSARSPASEPTPAAPPTSGRQVPINMSPHAVHHGYAPNPLAKNSRLPRTFQEGCRAQLDYVTTGDPTDLAERRARFLEEALELVQSLGTTQPEAAALVEYVFGRSVGEPGQELGGTACTLAHLATWAGLDLDREGIRELNRTWHPDVVAKIRAKRATRHGRGVLPGVASTGGSSV